GVLRLVRESLENLAGLEVATSPDPEYAFEMALQRRFRLFVFQRTMPGLGGEMLYSLVSKAYQYREPPPPWTPAVVYIADDQLELQQCRDLRQDARVVDVITAPINIERLLGAVREVFGSPGKGR
ncbi:MAG: hypothetical protein ACC661_08900, partial [Verrucomicrobiales bacterium]